MMGGIPRTPTLPRRSERVQSRNNNQNVLLSEPINDIPEEINEIVLPLNEGRLNHTFSLPDLTEHQHLKDAGNTERNGEMTQSLSNFKLTTSVKPIVEQNQQPKNQRSSSSASTTKSEILKRRKLEIQLEFSRRKFEQQQAVLQLEESLALAQVEEEYDNVSHSSRSISPSMRHRLAGVACWVEESNKINRNEDDVQPNANVPDFSTNVTNDLPNYNANRQAVSCNHTTNVHFEEENRAKENGSDAIVRPRVEPRINHSNLHHEAVNKFPASSIHRDNQLSSNDGPRYHAEHLQSDMRRQAANISSGSNIHPVCTNEPVARDHLVNEQPSSRHCPGNAHSDVNLRSIYARIDSRHHPENPDSNNHSENFHSEFHNRHRNEHADLFYPLPSGKSALRTSSEIIHPDKHTQSRVMQYDSHGIDDQRYTQMMPEQNRQQLGKRFESSRKQMDDHHQYNNQSNTLAASTDQQQSKIYQIENWIARQSFNKELPKFSGNPLEWPQFIHQYETTTKLCNLSDAENQIRLQKCLTGLAINVVQPLLIYPQNVSRVIQILKNRFGRTEHIVYLLLDRVKKFNSIKDDNDLNSLIDFFDIFSNFIYTLESLNERDHIRNPLLYNEILNKLPMKLKFEFVEYLDSLYSDNPALIILHEWLERKVSAAHKLLIPSISKSRDDSKGTKSKVLNFSIVDVNKKIDSCCLYCNDKNHFIQTCEKFKKISVNERWNFITKKHACISCLKLKHSLKFCKKRKKCGVNNCEKFHNILLHNTSYNVVSKSSPVEISSETNLHVHNENDRLSLLKILPVQLKGPNIVLDTFALLDEGSTVTIIDSDVADQLGLDGPSKHLRLQWTNDQINDQRDSKVVSLGIRSCYNSAKFFTLRHVKTVRNLNLPTQSLNMEYLTEKYPYLNHLKALSYSDARPIIIIGQDNWPVTVTRKLTHGIWNGPVASKTLLGWVVHGNICDKNISQSDSDCVFHVNEIDSCSEKDDLDILHDLIKQQWSFDITGTHPDITIHPSKEDKYCYDIMDATICRIGDKFEAGLLWCDRDVVLPESKPTALKRLECLEKKMDRDRTYGKLYVDKMNDYIEKGYLKKIVNPSTENSKLWYLPHFGVTNPHKPGKLRIVFDGAAKTNGKSLNDFLLVGPDLYNLLPNILLNFRIPKFAFVGDIKEMFLQIGVRYEDRFAQRLLWRGFDRVSEPDTYEFQVVFFGAKCSPCIAQEVKNRNAKEFMSDYPQACKDILKKHYMDDYLGGAETEENAIKLIREVIHVHKKGGFEICNFVSNSQTVLENIDENLHSKNLSSNFNISSGTEERVLGMWWDYSKDEFLFKLTFHKITPTILNYEKIPSKRDILKIVMSVFDPLGFISNLIIEGKILMQQIWEAGIGWDDEIRETHYNMWVSWSTNLKKCTEIRIPRIIFSDNYEKCRIELHVFCDASELAYASVAYLRFMKDFSIKCSLVSSKARVAPLKPVSVPRLELQAALLGARLSKHLKNSLELNIDRIVLWSDSQIVLSWIKTSSKRFKTYVAQRIGEIHELTRPSHWKYISSKLNIADEATKIKNINLECSSTWFTGPKILYQADEDWPDTVNFEPSSCSLNELKPEFCILINNAQPVQQFPIPEIDRFSSWLRFLRTTAWVIKFVNKLKSKMRNNSHNLVIVIELLPQDITIAENLIFRKIQYDSYKNEIDCLKNNIDIPKTSGLYSFACFLDENDILRLRGRLSNSSDVSSHSKHPIILDPSHKIVKLLIQYYHKMHNHIGVENIICTIRDRFWITNIRRAVKHAAYICQFCRIKKSKTIVPRIGQLPACRVERTIRPFLKCGIDYFGPINVTVNRHQEKRYGVVFVCMALKAVHIEIAHDLSFNSFMHVFIQFGNRRGFPTEIYSDNGKQFTKASKEIKDALESWPENDLTQFLTHRKCQWYFNAPAAPHTGGLWERMIRSIKLHLSNILKERSPREYVLKTLFCEIEGIINSRPLTFNSCDPNDLEPITPNHFLIGQLPNCYPLVSTSDKDLIVLSEWKASQRLADMFWRRWITEYLPSILHSRKWSKETDKISMGDLVIIVDSNSPRNVWPRGIIEKVYPAKDGQIRFVDVKTNVGKYRRHIKYIIKLDLLNSCNSLDHS